LRHADWPMNKALPHLQACHFGRTAALDQSSFSPELPL
jgi:hypothetical protein